jgi:hypothetical protein
MPGTIVEVILPLQREDSAGFKETPRNARRQKQGA